MPNVFTPSENRSSLLDAGWYVAQIVKSEIKPTKDNTGKRLLLSFRILEGDDAGKMVFAGLNIVNKNPVAEGIAKQELANICDAAGVEALQDTEELHGIPMGVFIDIETGNASFPDRNVPKKYCQVDDIPEPEGDLF